MHITPYTSNHLPVGNIRGDGFLDWIVDSSPANGYRSISREISARSSSRVGECSPAEIHTFGDPTRTKSLCREMPARTNRYEEWTQGNTRLAKNDDRGKVLLSTMIPHDAYLQFSSLRRQTNRQSDREMYMQTYKLRYKKNNISIYR